MTNSQNKNNPYRDVDVERDELMIQELKSKTTEEAVIEAKVEEENNERKTGIKKFYDEEILPLLEDDK